MEMRRFDFWVGRLAAAAGLVYVILCSLWPLSASAGDDSRADRPMSRSSAMVAPDERLRSMIDAPLLASTDVETLDPSELPALLRSVVVLAVIATLVLFRRWHDPHASLDEYREATRDGVDPTARSAYRPRPAAES